MEKIKKKQMDKMESGTGASDAMLRKIYITGKILV